jgi:hypothetical protein
VELDAPTRKLARVRDPPDDDPGIDPQTGRLGDLPGDAPLPAPHRVARGETLGSIAHRALGDASRWPELYVYNRDRIGADPSRLRPGVRLEMPPPFFKVGSGTRASLVAPSSIEGVTRSVVAPGRSRALDVESVGVELASRLGGSVNAVMLMALMGEGGAGPVYRKGMEQIRAVTGRDITTMELRGLDRFLTTYASATDPPRGDDPARYRRVIAGEAQASGIGAATVAYSALRGLSQMTGVDFTRHVTRGAAQPSIDEVWRGLRGAFYGPSDST